MTKQAPVILQLSDTECGIACLAMAMAYYKYYVPIETLRDQCGASRDGCKAQTLIDTATMHGFEANAYRIEIDDLKDISHPVIAHWSFRHYIVINDIKKNYVSINDPACGVRRISIAEFNQSFTGIIISISPTNQVATNKRHHTFYKSMMPYLAGSYSELTFLVTCLLTYSICIYMRTSIYSIFINQYFVDKNNDSTIRMIFLTFIVSFIYITSSLLHKLVQFKANIKKSTDKMSEIISHLLKLPIVYFALRQRSEIIATVFKSEAVFHSVIKNYSNITSSLLVASIIFSLMIIINSSLTISVSIFTFCYILFFFIADSYHQLQ